MKNITLLCAFWIAFASCNSVNEPQAIDVRSEFAPADLSESALEKDVSADGAAEAIADKIIKTGDFRYEVRDLAKAFSFIQGNIKQLAGFIENDNTTNYPGSQQQRLVIRIPSKNFDAFLQSLEKEVSYFDTKTISSTNVTAQFIDVEARLKTKKALEQRYLDLLNRTNKMSEIIELERSLSAIREEIESVQGQLNYLQDQVSMSTITIEFYTKSATGTGVTESYFRKIANAFVSGFYSLSGFILGIIEFWPYLIMLAVLITLLRKKVWRKRKEN